MIKRFLKAAAILLITAAVVYAAPVRPYTEHKTYFKGNDYELNVYKIYGRRDGNTMLIIGGVQGDEPGGFLSADLYAGIRLEQGNLIVIPRANLKSVIMFNRGVDSDMNRLFIDNTTNTSNDQEVVKVLIAYMKEADIFLNLHDGRGFHNPIYINEHRNPNRFGQSVIVDTDAYKCGGNTLNLKSMATTVLNSINARIPDTDHHLTYFNTKTDSPDTPFKDMRKTATWYALRHFCIPAFGIESSKNIQSIELKILYHNYAVNEFMKLMDIIPENPPIYVAPAVLENALITVNGESLTVKNGDVIKIKKNDVVSVKHIETNYERGISCDILGFGNLNNIGKEIPVTYSTKIVFRKDNAKFAEIAVEVDKDKHTAVHTAAVEQQASAVAPPASAPRTIVEQQSEDNKEYIFYVAINEKEISVKPEETLVTKTGSRFKILRLERYGKDTDLPVNLRGWVPRNVTVNSGDDRGYVFVVNPSDMITRWATDKQKRTYPVTVESEGKEFVRFYIKIE
ncbi:MAG: hypothetical protein LBH05_04645 [Deferribacteraceae bacterium]|jgi:hypothetical protein|nr:hypothetical protein [Deferribacteraceae bacterium]